MNQFAIDFVSTLRNLYNLTMSVFYIVKLCKIVVLKLPSSQASF